jgi:Tfp pilus assembly major pilin PilA
MSHQEAAILAGLISLAFFGVALYYLFRYAKSIFLPKSRMHIAIGVMIFGFALILLGAATGDRSLRAPGVFFMVIGLIASAMSIFIAKIMAEKYQPYLRKGKSTTAEQLMTSLKKKNVDTVLFELNSLFDRGYLPGFTVNMESHAVTPAATQGAVKGIVQMVNNTVSTIKGAPETPYVCKKCGATVPDTGAANCEFCGAPLLR